MIRTTPDTPEIHVKHYNLQPLYVNPDFTHMQGQELFPFLPQDIQNTQRQLKGLLQDPLLGDFTNPSIFELPDKLTKEIIEGSDLSEAYASSMLQERYGFKIETQTFPPNPEVGKFTIETDFLSEQPTRKKRCLASEFVIDQNLNKHNSNQKIPDELLEYVSALLKRIKQTLPKGFNPQLQTHNKDTGHNARDYTHSVPLPMAVNKRIFHDIVAQLVNIIPPGKKPIKIIRIIQRTTIQETWGALPPQDFGEIHEDIIAAFLWE